MPRHHTIWDAAQQKQIDVPFTQAEEDKKDAEEAAWAAGAPDRAAKATQDERRGYYESETDHLFFEEQRGEVPEGTWAAKVAEIKERVPKPE
jgi:hypothetical protein